MKVIAISGWKRSGKDTAADHLVHTFGFKRVSFADTLKDMAAEEYDVIRGWFDDPKYKESALNKYPVEPKDAFSRMIAEFMHKEFVNLKGEHPVKYMYDNGKFLGIFADGENGVLYHCPRSLAILKGSTNRVVTPNFWVFITMNRIALGEEAMSFNTANGQYVISDLRYKSEIEGLRMFLGDKLTTVRVNRFDDCVSTDPSERDLDDYKFDVVLDNKGSLDEFIIKVSQLVTTNSK